MRFMKSKLKIRALKVQVVISEINLKCFLPFESRNRHILIALKICTGKTFKLVYSFKLTVVHCGKWQHLC